MQLVFEGKNQPSGYTEPVLHKKRLEKKYQIKINANIFLFNFFFIFFLKSYSENMPSLKKYLNNNKDYKDINRTIYILKDALLYITFYQIINLQKKIIISV